jgi:hypothetical protein
LCGGEAGTRETFCDESVDGLKAGILDGGFCGNGSGTGKGGDQKRGTACRNKAGEAAWTVEAVDAVRVHGM